MLLDVHLGLLAVELQVLGQRGLGAASAIEHISESVKVVLVLLKLHLLASDMCLDLREPIQSDQGLLLVLVDLATHRCRLKSASSRTTWPRLASARPRDPARLVVQHYLLRMDFSSIILDALEVAVALQVLGVQVLPGAIYVAGVGLEVHRWRRRCPVRQLQARRG